MAPRGAPTRYDQIPRSYLAGVHLCAAMIWIKDLTRSVRSRLAKVRPACALDGLACCADESGVALGGGAIGKVEYVFQADAGVQAARGRELEDGPCGGLF